MASVLETFFILFESDASDAKKGVDDLDKSLGETSKAAKKSISSTDKATEAFVGMGKNALQAAAGVFALGSMIAGISAKAAQLDELGKFSELIGENIGDVDAWSQAAVRAGGSADSFRQSIKSLNEKVVDASVRGMNEVVPFFNQLGISIVDAGGKARSSLEILPELASAFERLSRQEALGLGQKLGLDQGTILLLQSGRREVDDLVKKQRDLGVATKEAAELSADFNDEMSDLRQSLSFASQSMLVSVLPAINSMLDAMVDVVSWMNKNKELVQGFFIAIGVAVARFALPPMIALAAAVIAAVAPFAALSAAVVSVGAAFALAFEDVMKFRQGQDSLLGEMLKKWPLLSKIFDELQKGANKLWETLQSIMGFFTTSFSSIFGDDGLVINAQQAVGVASASPLPLLSTRSIRDGARFQPSRSTSVQTGDIIINTQATDANGIAQEAARSISEQLNTAVDNFDDGLLS